MKVFWLFVVVLVIVAGGALVMTSLGQQRAMRDLARAQVEGDKAAWEAAASIGEGAELEAARERAEAALAELKAQAAPAPAEAPPAEAAPKIAVAGTDESGTGTPDGGASGTAPAEGGTTLPPIDGFEVSPGTIERRADGTTLVDGRFVMKGEGTAESPYEITWEQLASVADLFDPTMGRRRVPFRAAVLNGRTVRISGYIAYPLMVKEPRECLVMLNQWDGCCIGVPPSPYDAIEVTLAQPATGDDVHAIAGSITGVFEARPYVTGDWLIGLYLLKRARLEATDWGGPAGN